MLQRGTVAHRGCCRSFNPQGFLLRVGTPTYPESKSLILHNLPRANQRCLLAKIHPETRAVRTFNNRPDYSFLDSASGQEVHADMLADLEYALYLLVFVGHGRILPPGFGRDRLVSVPLCRI